MIDSGVLLLLRSVVADSDCPHDVEVVPTTMININNSLAINTLHMVVCLEWWKDDPGNTVSRTKRHRCFDGKRISRLIDRCYGCADCRARRVHH